MDNTSLPKQTFSSYQVFLIVILAFLQFSLILDFMVLSPLSPILLEEMQITTTQFSLVVAAYPVAACISGILAAGFSDKFDRKRLLLFFYAGFILGTLFCALAPNYELLVAARVFTGLFGGVIGSITMAIVGDVFLPQMRGRVMGFVQMAFAVSQILGIPIGLYLSIKLSWHAPFFIIVGVSIPVFILIALKMQSITAHIEANKNRNAFVHLVKTASNVNYLRGFLASTLLATGGFMMMPLGNAFAEGNLGLNLEKDLPLLTALTGLCGIVMGPLFGWMADKIGKIQVFLIGSILISIFVIIYTRLGVTPFWTVFMLNVLMFAGISSRMISAQALIQSVPAPEDRGAYMSINSSVQYLAGALGAIVTGLIAWQDEAGKIHNYPIVGYVVIGTTALTFFFMWRLNALIKRNGEKHRQPEPTPVHPDTIDELEPIVQPVNVEGRKDDF